MCLCETAWHENNFLIRLIYFNCLVSLAKWCRGYDYHMIRISEEKCTCHMKAIMSLWEHWLHFSPHSWNERTVVVSVCHLADGKAKSAGPDNAWLSPQRFLTCLLLFPLEPGVRRHQADARKHVSNVVSLDRLARTSLNFSAAFKKTSHFLRLKWRFVTSL